MGMGLLCDNTNKLAVFAPKVVHLLNQLFAAPDDKAIAKVNHTLNGTISSITEASALVLPPSDTLHLNATAIVNLISNPEGVCGASIDGVRQHPWKSAGIMIIIGIVLQVLSQLVGLVSYYGNYRSAIIRIKALEEMSETGAPTERSALLQPLAAGKTA